MEIITKNGNYSINGDVSSIIFGTREDDMLLIDCGADKETFHGDDSAETLEESSTDLLAGGTNKFTIVFWSRQ